MQKLLYIKSIDQFKQVWGAQKNDRNEINSCGWPSRLRNHLLITSGYPFWYCYRWFIFQDYNA